MLVDELIGAWALEDFSAARDGVTTHPLGDRPGGLLLYTADGWMSALLTPDPETRTDGTSAEGAPGGTVAYAGRWSRTAGGVVLHHVWSSHYAPWVGATLERGVHLRPGARELELTAVTTRGSRWLLRWRRAASTDRPQPS
ncbi:lipocalin-like domain-containing protein [Streptomyces sp. ISL-36]|uniref:lipocalin-like domain-containing protein n=1 Tax=Streptomyces sp. ISL-36 TaxID=2819182 RepID=UPI001BEA3AD6|nr:lipocalin-like domain-containing protein [Streptomyces sp. ISL-36]MBT2445144.1 lipocalin-like domain-containing protein [Streptomyces sp. ISL-36]